MDKNVVWKTIPNFSRFEASTEGNIRHVKHKRVRVITINSSGYGQCSIMDDSGKIKNVSVHRAIYLAFYGSIPPGSAIDHINRDRLDNNINNLRAVTVAENNKNRKFGDTNIEQIKRIIELHNQGLSPWHIFGRMK